MQNDRPLTTDPSAKSKVVKVYEVLLGLTILFSLFVYGYIIFTLYGAQDPIDPSIGAVFIIAAVLGTVGSAVVLATIRAIFRNQFSKRWLHSGWILLIISIPVLMPLGVYVILTLGELLR